MKLVSISLNVIDLSTRIFDSSYNYYLYNQFLNAANTIVFSSHELDHSEYLDILAVPNICNG